MGRDMLVHLSDTRSCAFACETQVASRNNDYNRHWGLHVELHLVGQRYGVVLLAEVFSPSTTYCHGILNINSPCSQFLLIKSST